MDGPVTRGSDFNGVAGHVGPRFGNQGCGQTHIERLAQERQRNRQNYPFFVKGFGEFDKQVTSQKAVDINVDGLAHIGSLPDMIADLE